MNKTLLLVFALIFASTLISCKKDWTCTCSDNGEEPKMLPIKNVTKPDAEAACAISEDLWDECYIN